MKKEYHGFRAEKIDISKSNSIIVASGQSSCHVGQGWGSAPPGPFADDYYACVNMVDQDTDYNSDYWYGYSG